MDLDQLQRSWNDLAKKDAMWAVLTGPWGTARTWDADTFFQTGTDEIEYVLGRVSAAGAQLRFDRALDFGCGVGRLTQALGRRFALVDGVDIAPSMIEQARALNRVGDRCRYHLNDAGDLGAFATGVYDFVYSSITLQHMEPRYSRRYIEEFFRVVRPGGIVMFQLPGEPVPVERQRTRNTARLPLNACRAAIDAPPELRCAPGATVPLRILVRNDGASMWPAKGDDDGRYQVRLGNHWRGRFRRVVRFDDARRALAHDVGPGESLEIGIDVEAPRKPGTYTLEFDMVQEHVRWFAKAGSRPSRTRVIVDKALRPGEIVGIPPVIEVYGIPRPEVEALMAARSGILLAAEDNDAPGPGWTSYRYIAQAAV